MAMDEGTDGVPMWKSLGYEDLTAAAAAAIAEYEGSKNDEEERW